MEGLLLEVEQRSAPSKKHAGAPDSAPLARGIGTRQLDTAAGS
jgi:hypothetical protein